VWEAFVSGSAKRDDHAADAAAGVEAFRTLTASPVVASCIKPSNETYSLIGAALLRSGWSTDLGLLSAACLVVRADSVFVSTS
jgi:hypothetical protein